MAAQGRKTTDKRAGPKIKQIIAISPRGLEILQEQAKTRGTNRSEVVERLACRELGKPAEAEFLDEELELMQQALTLQLAFLEDELGGRGGFSNPEIIRRDPAILHQKLETLNLTLEKVKIRLRDFLQTSVQS